uniref:Uncharacterized protein n=1 Tax=Anguilla anguilla TaxID=7936 RepID=A0A0E9U0Z2_ANGAN
MFARFYQNALLVPGSCWLCADGLSSPAGSKKALRRKDRLENYATVCCSRSSSSTFILN